MSSSFRDLRVWQESIDLTAEIYKKTTHFPKYEIYGLTQQIRRAAVSIANNIAREKDTDQIVNSCTSCFTLEVLHWKRRLNS